jgi:hypothetical protein
MQPVLCLRLRCEATACVETSQCRTRLRTVGIELLGCDEFRSCLVEICTVGSGLVCGRHGGEQVDGFDTHPTA